MSESFDELVRLSMAVPTDWGGYECLHRYSSPTVMIQRDGRKSVVLQCSTCGSNLRMLKQENYPDLDALPPFDGARRDNWSARVSEHARLTRQAKTRAESDKWFAEYSYFLASDEWKDLRSKVMVRANGICEACLVASAEQVHHTTYSYGLAPPAFLLVAVCKKCHDTITKMDRSNRRGGE